MGKIIAIANHKGGVGKTTTAAAIGQAIARNKRSVLLVDLDAQANLTSFFVDEETVEQSIYDAMTGRIDHLPTINAGPGLKIVPSSLDLAAAETDLASRLAREKILSRLLEPVKDQYDYIILDCPPSLGIVTTNALAAATDLYIPLTAEALPLKGLKMLEEIVEAIRTSINGQLSITGVIITRYNNRKLNKAVLDAIKARYGDRVFDTKIRENIAVAEAPLYGESIFDYAPDSNGAKDYDALSKEIINR